MSYKNVIENESEKSVTISFYKGNSSDYTILKPIKKYAIKYGSDGYPVEKIQYKWNGKKHIWIVTDKYEYLYSSTGELFLFTY